MAELQYHIKVPGIDDPIRIDDRRFWRMAMYRLDEQMQRAVQPWCSSQPPVVLVCTKQQAERCSGRGWVNSVRLEAKDTFTQTAPTPQPRNDAPHGGLNTLEDLLGAPRTEAMLDEDDAAPQLEELDDSSYLNTDDGKLWPVACDFFLLNPDYTGT